MTKAWATSIACSVLLHAALFAILAYKGMYQPGSRDGQAKAQRDQITAEIIDKPSKKSDDISVAIPEAKGAGDRTPHAKDTCPSFFGGIGITQGFNPNSTFPIVTEVHHGYPAEKAGVQVGDYLLNSDGIRGEIGTELDLELERNGAVLVFHIVRDKICTQEGAKP